MPEQQDQPQKMPEQKPGQGGFRKNVPSSKRSKSNEREPTSTTRKSDA